MKRSELATASRQSHWAIIFIVLRFVRKLAIQSWPILLGLLFRRSQDSSVGQFELYASGVGLLGAVGSVLAYFRFYYHVSDHELIIQKGILKKVHLNIPFERIQSVNFRETLLHSFLGVTAVEIESAGSKEKELTIDAIEITKARRLRDFLLVKRNMAISHRPIYIGDDKDITSPKAESLPILRLSLKDLLNVGITQNHLKPIGLLIGLGISVFFYSRTFDFRLRDVYNIIEEYKALMQPPDYFLLIIVLLFFMLLYSIIITFLKYFNLEFNRYANKFKIVQGLFTRHEFSALDSKVQILNWHQNVLQKFLGFFDIRFKQASSEKRVKEHFTIPGCSSEKVSYVQEAWLGKPYNPASIVDRVSAHYFYYSAKYLGILSFVGIATLIYFGAYLSALFVFVVACGLIGLHFLRYKKLYYSYNGSELLIRGGALSNGFSLIPIYKVQNISITQNYYQWSRQLATLQIFTAAGVLRIPFIEHQRATELLDAFLFEAQKNPKNWM